MISLLPKSRISLIKMFELDHDIGVQIAKYTHDNMIRCLGLLLVVNSGINFNFLRFIKVYT